MLLTPTASVPANVSLATRNRAWAVVSPAVIVAHGTVEARGVSPAVVANYMAHRTPHLNLQTLLAAVAVAVLVVIVFKNQMVHLITR